jgi:hypothetical protein
LLGTGRKQQTAFAKRWQSGGGETALVFKNGDD